jgi:hypothetical protein
VATFASSSISALPFAIARTTPSKKFDFPTKSAT